jgi:hypothetical protein
VQMAAIGPSFQAGEETRDERLMGAGLVRVDGMEQRNQSLGTPNGNLDIGCQSCVWRCEVLNRVAFVARVGPGACKCCLPSLSPAVATV